ncbi:hypothetical protein BX600DRAFT_506174 [Xylariales sp. PMI_506]|nr:hypothetical protein BX600DRAFT_506174 [Xylariales sp. PMI_506]
MVRGNQALNVNSVVGMHADLEITTRGSDWYFTVCAVMAISTLFFIGWSYTKPQSHRIFHNIIAGSTAVACIAYFAMGSNLGQVPIQVEFVRLGSSKVGAAGTREIFYARYIDWSITTPLLLLNLLLTAGVPASTILITMLADEIMVVCGLIGALTQTSYKWGFWTMGIGAFLFVVFQIFGPGRSYANALGGEPRKAFMTCGAFLMFIWFLYPIAWAVCEGGNVIHPDSEAIFYGILDLLAKPGFGFTLLFLHRNITPEMVGLRIREPSVRTTTATQEKYTTNPRNGAHSPDRAVSRDTYSSTAGHFTGAYANVGQTNYATTAGAPQNGHGNMI